MSGSAGPSTPLTSAVPTTAAARYLLAAAIGASTLLAAQHISQKSGGKKKKKGKSKPQGRIIEGDSDEAGPSSSEPRATIARPGVVRGVAGLIGNTPLMRIESLSELTGCEILGKAEYLNPAGSPKDRVALQILLDAESSNLLTPHSGDTVFEGTVGSTGISLATLCRAKGYKCAIVLPDDVATEKAQLLEKLGAQVKKVRPRGIVDPRHFVNEARANAIAFEDEEAERERDGQEGTRRPRGFFADQFETTSNFTAHYRGTGPEIWAQCGGGSDDTRRPQLDAFVAGAGTGGTLSGVAAALREREVEVAAREAIREQRAESRWWPLRWLGSTNDDEPQASREAALKEHASIRIVLADPHGSGLFNKVHHGVMYSSTEAEGTRRRHQVDSIVEGIGMNRITRNLSFGVHLVDDAVRVQDEEAVRMSRWLSVRDGLFVGSSSCVNVVAAVRTALRLKKEWEEKGKEGSPTVVTILCDSGVRHLSKFHNDEILARDYGIQVPADAMDVDISDILRP